MRLGIPAATSTFSMARRISPRASSIVFPMSCTTTRARSSAWCSIRSRRTKKWRARSNGGVSRHASQARRAFWTARSTSSFVESGTREFHVRLLRPPILHELERPHRTDPADLAHAVVALEDLIQPLPDKRFQLLRLWKRLLKHIDRLERRGADDGISAERAAQAPRSRSVHDRGLPGHAAERQSASDGLAAHEDIRHRVPILDRPQLPGAAHAGLYLVVYEHDAMGVAQLAEEREEFLGRDDHPAFPLDRFGEDCGDAARDLRLIDEPLDFLDAGFRALRGRKPLRVAVRVRIVREDHLPDERTESFAVRLVLPRQADVEERAPMERGLEGDEPRPLGRGTRDLDGVLDRLR